MEAIKNIHLDQVRQLLERHNSNMRFNNYHLPDFCPENEFQCYKVTFDDEDIDRMSLVENFKDVSNKTCKLKEINRSAVLAQKEEDRGLRVKRLMDGGDQFERGVNLITDQGFEIVLVGRNLCKGSLLIIDGSHRAIAHYLNYGTLQGVSAFICVHNNIAKWGFYKPIANV
jgi:hypothetical protein